MLKFIELGLAAFPAAIPFKRDPFTAAALITGGAGLFSSLLGAKSQSSTNKNYLKGVRETNEMNYKIARETNDLNRELYEKNVQDNRVNAAMENAYNSPAAQLARLRQAGINAYQSSSGVQIQSASPNAMQSAEMQAPNQVPAPFSGMNLGGIAQDALKAYQSGQEIESSKMDLYQKGVDTEFYLRNKILEMDGQIVELQTKKILNQQESERLTQLRIDRKYYEQRLNQQISMNDETIKNLRLTGKKIERETTAISEEQSRADKALSEQVRHQKSLDATGWFNAHTQRHLSKAQAHRLDTESEQMWSQLELLRDKNQSDLETARIQRTLSQEYFKLDAQEKDFVRARMIQEISKMKLDYQKASQLMDSPFGYFAREVLGIDLGSVNPSFGFYKNLGK